MNKLVLIVSFAVLSLTMFTGCDDDDELGPLESAEFREFNDAMRELWSDHVVWTRNVIIGVLDDAPGTTEAVNRLLLNQDQIGDAIKPYYGDAAGESLSTLLREHITLAADILNAANVGDTPTFNAKVADWRVNGDEIAAFLNAANPEHFGLAEWKAMMKDHLDMTLEEATARLNGDYATDVAVFDQIYEQALMMADMLAEGIANQFPDDF